MSGKHYTDLRKVKAVPDGMAFVQLSIELLTSPAWRGRSINCGRFIEFLMIEHMHHAGRENGWLLAPYDQLVKFGITRRLIRATIEEAVERGLVAVVHGIRRTFKDTSPSRYRLTFLPEKVVNAAGITYFAEPTNEWKRFKPALAENRTSVPEGELDQFPKGNSQGSRRGTLEASETAENCGPPTVPEGEPLYISWLPENAVGTTEPEASPAPCSPDRSAPHAGRQHRDPDVIDIEDYLGARPDETESPQAKLRRRLVEHIAAAPRGEITRLARRVGVSRAQLGNFKDGRFGLNRGAEAALRQILT
jgi:hypothetical protein